MWIFLFPNIFSDKHVKEAGHLSLKSESLVCEMEIMIVPPHGVDTRIAWKYILKYQRLFWCIVSSEWVVNNIIIIIETHVFIYLSAKRLLVVLEGMRYIAFEYFSLGLLVQQNMFFERLQQYIALQLCLATWLCCLGVQLCMHFYPSLPPPFIWCPGTDFWKMVKSCHVKLWFSGLGANQNHLRR